MAASSGTIRVLGEDPRRFRRRTREQIGYMPQQFTLYDDLTAGENIDFVAGLFGMLWFRRRRRVAEVLKLTELWDARGRRAADLSGGMQRRLELACALVHEPALFFLDEPTAGIDPLLRGKIWEELHRLKDEGRTLLVTTQYINETEECDRVAFIAHGRLIALETPAALSRLAVGGDVIEVQVVRAFDAEALLKHDDVRAIDQRGPRTFLVTVDDASTATARDRRSGDRARRRVRERARVSALLRRGVRSPRRARRARTRGDSQRRRGRRMIVLQIGTRLLAFIGKELVEVVRRPGAIVSLVIGPFLIMAIFGAGYSGFKRPLQTVIVVPPESGLTTDPEAYQSVDAPGFQIVAVTADRASAEADLQDRKIDLVVVAPTDIAAAFEGGRQSEIIIEYNLIDPVQAAYTDFLAQRLEAEVNREVIERAAEEGQAYALERGQTEAARIPPDVIASPTKASTSNLSPTTPNVVSFFGPAVLALILQHMAVSLVAISLVRERSSGIIEVFRVAPVAAWEVVLGKLLAFGVLNGAIASVTVLLLVNVLGVPLLGDPALLAGVLALLIVGSIGIGMVFALVV